MTIQLSNSREFRLRITELEYSNLSDKEFTQEVQQIYKVDFFERTTFINSKRTNS